MPIPSNGIGIFVTNKKLYICHRFVILILILYNCFLITYNHFIQGGICMKTKRLLSLFIALVLCFCSCAAYATEGATDGKQNGNDRLEVFYNDEVISFDVEPIIENGRTLVPMRAVFEAMGCAVYYSADDGKQIISARRGNDNLLLTIGENKMYFNSEEKELDVPAKIKDGRTLVPLRAISEAFECEVHWYGDTKTIYIYSPANAYSVCAEKIEETITDDEGNILIEAVAYYPVIKNPYKMPCFDIINFEYAWDADKFIEEARAKKEDAINLRKEMGEAFTNLPLNKLIGYGDISHLPVTDT